MTPEPLTCGFCPKNQNEVELMIEGPLLNICSECVEKMNKIVVERRELTEAAGG